MFVTPSNSKYSLSDDYRIIWFCCKTLLKHLKDSDVSPHVKTIIVYLLSEDEMEYLYFRSFWRFENMLIR